jgi:hypothetical protein
MFLAVVIDAIVPCETRVHLPVSCTRLIKVLGFGGANTGRYASLRCDSGRCLVLLLMSIR